jgi:hypothetical protein
MGKALLAGLFLFFSVGSRAQNFFYVEAGSGTEECIKSKLAHSFQFITKSLLESDYTVKPVVTTNADLYQSFSITVVDTMTQKTVFVAQECFPPRHANSRIPKRVRTEMIMTLLLEKNFQDILMSARMQNHEILTSSSSSL